jgi:hypothetical protein
VTKRPFLPETFDGQRLLWSAPVERGRWVDWEFRVRWSWRSDGLIEVRRDGETIVRATGANTYRDLVAPYMKFGVYLPAWAFDELPSRAKVRSAYFERISVDRLDRGVALGKADEFHR